VRLRNKQPGNLRASQEELPQNLGPLRTLPKPYLSSEAGWPDYEKND